MKQVIKHTQITSYNMGLFSRSNSKIRLNYQIIVLENLKHVKK